ncbi:MAG TPA: C40 family peptidase [Gaiellaceae bacterium]|jgi:cell wall-associated NlpC family hydrolase|nr:C40 family peptidase [Gaiellaceae bacterium]
MRNIRLLLLLLLVAAAGAVALVRPLPGRANGDGSGTPTDGTTGVLPPVSKTLRRAKRRLSAEKRAEAQHFGSRVVRYARRFLGVPYSYGGTSPGSGFDCSGLVRYVYAHFGITLPHSSFSDLWLGRRVGRGGLRPGDLVFFDGGGHVGIYIGGDHFIDAPHTGSVVRISTMNLAGEPFYTARRLKSAR